MDYSILAKALDIIQDGLLIVDKDFLIEYANEPAHKLLRIPVLTGKKTNDVIWTEKMAHEKSPVSVAFDTGKMSDAETTFDDGVCLHIHAHPFGSDRVVVTVWNITDYVTLERRLEESRGNDAITGLMSSAVFHSDIEKELERAKRTKSEMTLILIDLGLIEGEENIEQHEGLLRTIADTIKNSARNYDITYRLYGDTFALLMPHCPIDNARGVAEHIIKKSNQYNKSLSTSVGISSSKNAFTGRDVIRLAERALYVAKHRGGNTYVIG